MSPEAPMSFNPIWSHPRPVLWHGRSRSYHRRPWRDEPLVPTAGESPALRDAAIATCQSIEGCNSCALPMDLHLQSRRGMGGGAPAIRPPAYGEPASPSLLMANPDRCNHPIPEIMDRGRWRSPALGDPAIFDGSRKYCPLSLLSAYAGPGPSVAEDIANRVNLHHLAAVEIRHAVRFLRSLGIPSRIFC